MENKRLHRSLWEQVRDTVWAEEASQRQFTVCIPRPASCNFTSTLCTQFKPSTGKRPSTWRHTRAELANSKSSGEPRSKDFWAGCLPSCNLMRTPQQITVLPCVYGLPWWLSGKNTPADVGHVGLIPGSGGSPRWRAWQPTPVFLPGESHGQRSLAGYSPQGHKSQTELSD